MIGVDTNVLVRYLVTDDVEQHKVASDFLNEKGTDDRIYVSLIVLVELVWVLRRLYGYSRQQVHSAVFYLLETVEISFEEEEYVSTLINTKGDIADHLIVFSAVKAGCSSTVTFDRDAAKAVPGMELLK